MYQKFSVSRLEIKDREKSILVRFTFDLDEDTVNPSTLYVTENNTEESKAVIVPVTQHVENDTVKLVFNDDLKVNTDYTINVTDKVQSVIEDNLEIEYQKDFQIKSVVDSIVSIVTPYDHQEIGKELQVVIRELPGPSGVLFNNFKIEVASDVLFNDVILDTVITDTNTATFAIIKYAKQYFIRARAVDEVKQERGNWSETVTFTAEGMNSKDCCCDDDGSTPTIIKKLNLIGHPNNGCTPHSIILEFDRDIDSDSFCLDDILLIRKEV